MTNSSEHNPAPDLWFESQKEAIRALRPDHKVDVTDAVMQHIASLPTPKVVPLVSRRRKAMRWVAAACVAAVVSSAALFWHRNVVVSDDTTEMAACLFDIYEYCNDYADQETDDEAAYYDNPVSYFM